MIKYIPIIGLEVHIEPSLKAKMFCRCPADHFGKRPNTLVCPICLGLPGALPYINWGGVEAVVKLGLAVGSVVNKVSRFYRKNYFYPDLPKGYQTSQLTDPFCVGGTLKGKRINHIHLEEDAGKLVHETVDGEKVSLIDFNRSGVALIEMVTEPDFHSAEEVLDFLKEVQLIARYLKVSNADMEKGSMRLEANISLAPEMPNAKYQIPNYKVEIKNINSFRFLEKAINAELTRQEKILSDGGTIDQETRGYDEVKQITFSQRKKGYAHDYRYFPEADLPPVKLSDKQIKNIMNKISELPEEKREKFNEVYKLPKDYAEILISDINRVNYFESAVVLGKKENIDAKTIADAMINKKLDAEFPEPAGLIKKLIELSNVEYSSQDQVENAVKSVLMENGKAINDYKNGNGNVIGFLIGMVQKKLLGKGNIQLVREKILEKLRDAK